ncbi:MULTISPECIES: MarR family winged helix-turn-helix transcriptional regulator [unclassified Dinoroseobacter]|uniref:MarR family winged helix-turn-helix transcriptional regulator n=1 Tax=unclassified Dinoroseobacter TaxID=2620028 RepID=UPI003C7AEFB0
MSDPKRYHAPKSLGRALNFAAGAGNTVCTHLLAPHGLSLAQWAVLNCLWLNGPLGVKALAELTGNAPPATSRLVDRMITGGLLTRRQSTEDRRAVTVDVTERGEALRPTHEIYNSVNTVLLDGFTEAEAEALFDQLARIEANAAAWLDKPSSALGAGAEEQPDDETQKR